MTQQLLELSVLRYLRQLELAVKQRVGVVPEDVLADAREFLTKDLQSLRQSEPGIDDEEVYEHFLTTFGKPDDVAQHYEDAGKPNVLELKGIAPNWRICCTRCGRSAPAARVGITRIGARSQHKYVVGWRHDCRWLRWMRLERDLDKTNLSDELGMDLTGEQLRIQKHKPVTLVFAVLAIVLPLALLLPPTIRHVVTAANEDQISNATFAHMPEGWTVDSHFVIPSAQLPVFSRKLGGSIVHGSNTVIRDGDRSLQINQLSCETSGDADAVQATLIRMKQNSRHVCRNGRDIYEFVCSSPEAVRFAIEARYRLPIQPAEARYRIQFDAVPVSGGDAMAWNKLFNLFLVWQTGTDREAVESRIAELSNGFQLSDQLLFKNTGLGPTTTQWSFSPEPSEKSEAVFGDATLYKLPKLPRRAGVPVVKVQGTVTSTTFATTPLSDPESRKAYLQANRCWPADSPEIEKLSSRITSGATTDHEKVDALLAWFANEQNIRFAGETGSRYGALKVLQQKHGHCWDYSDLFVTLCRASEIPARQVLGWLHRGEGHVWAEVLIDDRWRQLDPTTGVGCGSDYLPLVISMDGTMPLVYASEVKIELLETK